MSKDKSSALSDSGKDIMSAPDGARSDPEFSHIINLAELKQKQESIVVSATAKECALLAIRFDLPAIHSLSANISLSGDPIHMSGRMNAKIEQSCVATGENISAEIDEDIAINFMPVPTVGPNDSEIELEEDDCETIFHNGREIDIGEAIAQSLYLAIDPFPRIQNARMILAKAGVKSEEEIAKEDAIIKAKQNPFSALSALKK